MKHPIRKIDMDDLLVNWEPVEPGSKLLVKVRKKTRKERLTIWLSDLREKVQWGQ